jgi:CubicO group peptidase (beta-lactamase class C family)
MRRRDCLRVLPAASLIRRVGAAAPDARRLLAAAEAALAGQPVRGWSLCLARGAEILLEHGGGWADRAQTRPVEATSRFRIASVSKPLTLALFCRLVAEGKLGWEDRLEERLPPDLREPVPADPRWAEITLCHLAEHRAGFDRARSGDPMFRSLRIATERQKPPPAGLTDIIHHLRARPLDFAPGERVAYSNIGYGLLGRVLAHACGQSYGEAMTDRLLHPLNMRDTVLGRTLEPVPGEVEYDEPTRPEAASALDAHPGARVPTPYGAWWLEAMDAHGGWVSTARDLVRFGQALNATPPPPVLHNPDATARFRAPYTFYGALDGTSSVYHRGRDGWVWAALFNRRRAADGRDLAAVLQEALLSAVKA